MNMEKAFEQFLTALQVRSYSSHTLKAYKMAFDEWDACMDGDARLSQFTRQNIGHFLEYLHGRGLSKKSVRQKLHAIRSFSTWAFGEKILPQDVAATVRGPRIPNHPPEAPTELEVKRLISGKLPGSTFYVRDKLVLWMLYGGCGIRVGELASVDVGDFNRDLLLVKHGKGRKQRYAILGKPVRVALAAYMPQRNKLLEKCGNPDEPALLVGISRNGRGERLTVRSISRIVRTIATAKGLGHIHPHSLRHGFGQHTFDNDGSLPAIQRLMGHSRLTTTAAFYVDGSVPRILREIKKAHPHAN
jgi:integrase/recombinase XerC